MAGFGLGTPLEGTGRETTALMPDRAEKASSVAASSVSVAPEWSKDGSNARPNWSSNPRSRTSSSTGGGARTTTSVCESLSSEISTAACANFLDELRDVWESLAAGVSRAEKSNSPKPEASAAGSELPTAPENSAGLDIPERKLPSKSSSPPPEMSIAASRGAGLPFPDLATPDPVDLGGAETAFGPGAAFAEGRAVGDGLAVGLLLATGAFVTETAGFPAAAGDLTAAVAGGTAVVTGGTAEAAGLEEGFCQFAMASETS